MGAPERAACSSSGDAGAKQRSSNAASVAITASAAADASDTATQLPQRRCSDSSMGTSPSARGEPQAASMRGGTAACAYGLAGASGSDRNGTSRPRRKPCGTATPGGARESSTAGVPDWRDQDISEALPPCGLLNDIVCNEGAGGRTLKWRAALGGLAAEEGSGSSLSR